MDELPTMRAREVLAASNNDVSAALEWLQNDLAVSGARMVAKVAHRTAHHQDVVVTWVLAWGRDLVPSKAT